MLLQLGFILYEVSGNWWGIEGHKVFEVSTLVELNIEISDNSAFQNVYRLRNAKSKMALSLSLRQPYGM